MFPAGFEEKLSALLGAEYPAFLAAFDLPRNVGLRRNPLRGDHALPDFGLTPVPWCPEGFRYDPACRPGLHPYHEAGLYYLQEPSAMAPAELLDPQPGETVLDLCAAPGGKATQIAGKLMGQGLLVCNEIHPQRAKILSRNIERLGVTNALVLNEAPQALAARLPGFFDRVLVDAPCSGEGMFRKEEDAVTDWSPETVAMCAFRQLEVITAAAQLLRPGGRLVYSTCTFSPEENEGVIARFLALRPDFELEAVPAPHFSPARPDWADGNETLARAFRLWPHKLSGEGHFAAVLRHTGDATAAQSALLHASPMPSLAADFLSAHIPALPDGVCLQFGETVSLAPDGTPDLKGLKVLRAGLELGSCQKGRFTPAHALAPFAAEGIDFPADSDEVARYLRGETLNAAHTGWLALRTDALTLGWVKGADGILKNHFPKGLRWVSRPVIPGRD